MFKEPAGSLNVSGLGFVNTVDNWRGRGRCQFSPQLITMKSLQSIWGRHMSSITIRNLDENLKASLRMRAARHGVSMEQEMRNILQSTLDGDANFSDGLTFSQRINQRFKGLGIEELVLPARQTARSLPDFGKP
jgi:plasmid stability protein